MNEGSDATAIGDSPQVASRGLLRAWVAELRIHQWLKNGFVLVPLVFSGNLFVGDAQRGALLAFAAFCLAASAVYVANDLADRVQDGAHPVKRHRPIAAGQISTATAIVGGVLLALGGAFLAWSVSADVLGILLGYLALNALYSLYLKHVVILDVFLIAAFFVLRLVAGARAVGVSPSLWLLLCGGLLALYLGFAKRRHELVLLGTSSGTHRTVLSQYTTAFLDQLSTVLLAVTIVAYIMFTRESQTAQRLHADTLSYSTVMVLFGVFRYLYLVHKSEGGNPAETLLGDRALLGTVLLWIVYCATIIYRNA